MNKLIKILSVSCVFILLITFYCGRTLEVNSYFIYGVASVLLVGLILLASKIDSVFFNVSLISLIVISAYFGAEIDVSFPVIITVIGVLFSIFSINMMVDKNGKINLNSGKVKSSGEIFENGRVNFESMNQANVINPSPSALGNRGANGIPNQFNILDR
ncbi:hypothetical protein [Rosenbergiella collisarenosi]|uniref:hypothetical protein n=1 Tax=Rosenbergiella collisarenosi TaxID=1544695 RepID=UPI001F4D3D29|nr:hypothetical protein [Rosenbergiella collisarenosi]